VNVLSMGHLGLPVAQPVGGQRDRRCGAGGAGGTQKGRGLSKKDCEGGPAEIKAGETYLVQSLGPAVISRVLEKGKTIVRCRFSLGKRKCGHGLSLSARQGPEGGRVSPRKHKRGRRKGRSAGKAGGVEKG